MAVSQPMTPYGSRDAFLSGELWASAGTRDFMDTFANVLSKAVSGPLIRARQSLRSAALQHIDWAPLANILKLEFVDSEFVVNFAGTPEQNARAYDLEYGTEEFPPTGFLRKQLMSMTKTLQSEIDLELVL